MKKILRLVTTSVLTLTLVACGEASSSVSTSGTQTSSSVSSVSSAYANVTSVTLSAATATLTQVMGAQRRVTVTAALNANTNPNLTLEWYVNGVKQAQIGRVFDFTPTEVGSFAIQVRVGNISSNTLTVTLGLPNFVVTSSAFENASQIKLKAPGGATVTLLGAALDDSSYYDLAKGEYVINLEEPVLQGANVTVRLVREGFQTLNQVVTFDTRQFMIDEVTYSTNELKAVNGVYTIVKPLDKEIEFNRDLVITFDQKNFFGGSPVLFTREVSVPTGATAIAPVNSFVSGVSSLNTTVTVTNLTVAGLYTHKFTLGNKVVEVKLQVEDAKPAVNILDKFVFKDTENKELVNFGFSIDGDAATDDTHQIVSLGADGVYEVARPFATFDPTTPGANDTFVLRFIFEAYGFPIVENFNNAHSVSLTGPVEEGSTFISQINGMFTENATVRAANSAAITALTGTMSSTSVVTLATDLNDISGNETLSTHASGKTSALALVSQKIDRGTPLGLYTFSIKVGQLGREVERLVRVRVVEPAPLIDFVLTKAQFSTDVSDIERNQEIFNTTANVYRFEKPVLGSPITVEWFAILANFQSPKATFEEINADALLEVADKNLFTSATANVATIERWGTPVGADLTTVGSGSFKYVNYSLSVNGPSTLIQPILSQKAAIRLATDKNAVVLVEQSTLTDGTLPTTPYLTLAAYQVDTARGVTGSNVSVDAVEDQAGISRAPLTIDNTTVPGTYELTFIVGSVNKKVTIIVENPVARISFLNSMNTATPPAGIAVADASPYQLTGLDYNRLNVGQDPFVNGAKDTTSATSSDALSGYEVQQFVKLVNGVYTVEKRNLHVLSIDAVPQLFDLAIGTYNYSITKKYPDGRVESVSDSVVVTGVNTNGSVTITANTQFTTAFNVKEYDLDLGKYEYSFTVGQATLAFTIDVIANSQLKINSLMVGKTEAVFYNGNYRLPLPAADLANATVSATVELLNLPSDHFFTITRAISGPSTSISLGTSVADAALYTLSSNLATARLPLEELKELNLGSISTSTAVVLHNIAYTLRFFKVVEEYGVEVATQVGETQVIKFMFDAGGTPA
jgi:hypothetical protein